MSNTNTFSGLVSPSGVTAAWTAVPPLHSGSHATSRMRVQSGSTYMETQIAADTQHRGKTFILTPSPPNIPQHVRSLTWEVFVTPPASDLEEVARLTESFADRPLWETPSGFFLSGVFSIETGTTRWMSLPLSTVAVGGLRSAAQHLLAPVTFREPLHLPMGTLVAFRIEMKTSFCCPVPLTLRCSYNFDLVNPIELG